MTTSGRTLRIVELWASKGSGAWQVGDIYPGVDGSDLDNLAKVGKRLYFAANDGT
ncbi:MAG: hypothetical protein ACC726_13405 [Chloroflexota bacterium]